MLRIKTITRLFSLEQHARTINLTGIATNRKVLFNPTIPEIYEIAFKNQRPSDPYTLETRVSKNGALCAYSGLKTGREPQNSRLVKDSQTEKTVNWSKTNIPIDPGSFDMIEKIAVDYINHSNRCIIVDGYAGWDPSQRVKVRVYCTRTYHALFMKNMLIAPTQKQLDQDFTRGVDINIFNAGQLFASKNIPGITSNMVTGLNLTQRKMVILGSQFAGEMKKAVFKILQYYYPRKGILTLHASATLNQNNTSTIMCGLSATGKTALALRSSKRKVIGDDEICWSNKGLFNIQGGCYAKIMNLSRATEPQIYNAIKFGAIVENASFYPNSRELNFFDTSITPNARTSFPLNYLPNAAIPAVADHPKNIIFLTCDTKGVLPPVAKLSKQQAIYQFLSGYTAKIAGTDITIKTAQSTFSACFGEMFLPLHPTVYAKMLYDKINQHNSQVWIVNTGWTDGKYGVGKRINFEKSLQIIDSINNGTLDKTPTYKLKYFNFDIPSECPGIQQNLLHPQKGWNSKVEYDETLSSLAMQFVENYDKKFKGLIGQNIDNAGPKL